MLTGEPGVGLLAAVAAGQGDDPQHLRVRDQVRVEIVLVRQGQLEHDVLVGSEALKPVDDGRLEQLLGLGLGR